MQKELENLKGMIQTESKALICATHPQVCALRDQNYPMLENYALQMIFADNEPVSVQTALARLEQELGDAINNDEIV